MPEMEERRELKLMDFGRVSHSRLDPLDLANNGEDSDTALEFLDFGSKSFSRKESVDLGDGGEDFSCPLNFVGIDRFKMGGSDFSNGGEVNETKFVARLPKSRPLTHIGELPSAVLNVIFAMVSEARSRNCLSLTCKDWYYVERQTRSSLILRGNVANFTALPISFKFVTYLDLSKCSPWGYSVFQFSTDGETPGMLRSAFPNVKDLVVYVRDLVDVRMVVCIWPELESLKLVRFHQRSSEMGSEIENILRCEKLKKVDLSEFYCWTGDILPALESGSETAANLVSLNLLKLSPEGFQSQEIIDITTVCGNLEEFFVLCNFDPRYLDPVGDSTLECIGNDCPKLRVLHLVDKKEWRVHNSDVDDGGGNEDANVSLQGLESMFKRLPDLQDLVFLLAQNVWNSRLALKALFTNCSKLKSLHLSHFHGVCPGPEQHGLALGHNLTNLSIKSSVDLSDLSLVTIAKGCKKLTTLSLRGCKEISERGVNYCVQALSRTLVDVGIYSCPNLPAVETLRALEPIRSSIRRLHVDCIWDHEVVARQAAAVANGNCGNWETEAQALKFKTHDSSDSEEGKRGCASSSQGMLEQNYDDDKQFDLLQFYSEGGMSKPVVDYCVSRYSEESGSAKRARILGNRQSDLWLSERYGREEQAPDKRCWPSLEKLSLWVGVGLLISPLASMGLGECPVLEEVCIVVEGDCKSMKKPAARDWGLATMARYKRLSKLTMHLGEVASFSLSAPAGNLDMSIWERHYLSGIDKLHLEEVNYMPPCDKDFDHRGLSLPAVAHLSQCLGIRKLIVQGSAHEHFLSMLHRIATMRDFQLRWEFFPAPEYETRNEVRVEACRRFEAALIQRGFPD